MLLLIFLTVFLIYCYKHQPKENEKDYEDDDFIF